MTVAASTLMSIFFLLCIAGILLSLFMPAASQGRLLAWFGCLASAVLVWTGGKTLLTGGGFHISLWPLNGLATTLTLNLDRLSGVFLIVTGLVLFPASLFAGSELHSEQRGQNGRAFAVTLLGLYAVIGLIYIAGDVALFLFAWEVMSVLCYVLIMCGTDRVNGHLEAGYLLLAMGEGGTLAAALGFLVLGAAAGSLEFGALRVSSPGLGMGARWMVFLLSFGGFGVKAGLVPVNFWLPRAYTAAPRAFVTVLAGATLNLGLYGIMRVNCDLLPATFSGPGLFALVIGTLSALVGILYATTDKDLKMMLAHSSIENVGIVVAGIGAGMVFVATSHPALAAIAFLAGMYHLVNHSLYKTLLFCGVGAVEAQTGTRDMDGLGGLVKCMPLTALAFLAGTLSIAALPPFNGFVSEWLTLQSMLRSAELSSTAEKIVFALCGAGLALTAALAVTCFVKVFAMSFLGMRRLDIGQRVAEPGFGTLAPMAVLAVLCLAFGVLPTYAISALGLALKPLLGASAADNLVPPFFAQHQAHGMLPSAFAAEFHDLGAQVGQSILPGRGLVVLHRGGADNPVVFAMSTSIMFVVLGLLLIVTYVLVRIWLTSSRQCVRRERWDGGVRRLLPEMTYTATGFSNPVRVIFSAIFQPTTVEDTRETVAEHFRTAIRRERESVHLVDKLMFHPVKAAAFWLAGGLAAMHRGRVNAYLTYALLTLVTMWIVFSLPLSQ